MKVLLILTLMVMLFIFIQDLKYRAVYWWLFPLLFVLLGLFAAGGHQFLDVIERFAYNLGFLSTQLLLLMFYFAIKHKKIIAITKGHLGLGDILFLLVICIYLSFFNFVLFYIASLTFIVLFEIIKGAIVNATNKKIPLAGYQSLLLCACIVIDQFTMRLDLTNDLWLLSFLNTLG